MIMPRSHHPPHIFFEKMNKKPALQALLDNIDDYAIEELETIKGQPLWIREQLVRIKKEKDTPTDQTPDYIAEQLADMMKQDDSQCENRNQEYEIKKWVGNNWRMPAGRTGEYKVEINPGDLFLIYQPGRAKIQSSISNMDKQQWNYFQRYTEYIGLMNITEFAKFVSQNLAKQHPDAVEINLQDKKDPNVDDRGLFRIIRH